VGNDAGQGGAAAVGGGDGGRQVFGQLLQFAVARPGAGLKLVQVGQHQHRLAGDDAAPGALLDVEDDAVERGDDLRRSPIRFGLGQPQCGGVDFSLQRRVDGLV
jgi:hypothetical protein